MRTTQAIGRSPFEPIPDFRLFMTDPTARCRLREVPMSEPNTFDLIRAINTTHAAHEAFVSVRGAVVVGGDPIPLLADANARCEDLITAVEGLQDYLLAAIRERDGRPSAPRPAAEIVVGNDYRYIGGGSQYYTPGKLYRVRRVDTDGMFVLDDDDKSGADARHYWNVGTFQDRFEAVSDDAAMAAVEMRSAAE